VVLHLKYVCIYISMTVISLQKNLYSAFTSNFSGFFLEKFDRNKVSDIFLCLQVPSQKKIRKLYNSPEGMCLSALLNATYIRESTSDTTTLIVTCSNVIFQDVGYSDNSSISLSLRRQAL